MHKWILLGLGLAVCNLNAKELPKHDGSTELQKIKSLAGTWSGEVDMGQGPQTMTVIYKVTAGGSAVIETTFPGTPKEMVSMYHDEKGKLSMTHYCMLGNQPKMKMTGSKDNQISMKLAKKKSIKKDEMHVHGLVIELVDENNIKQTWSSYVGDKPMGDMTVSLSRKK
ncbi:MAG: hypothetical protein AAF492_15190 [Verrucomicrobiota bacterium]